MNINPRKSAALSVFLILSWWFLVSSLAQDTPPSPENKGPAYSSVEERRIVSQMQETLKNANDEKKDLSQREKELKTLNDAVDKKLEEISQKLKELQTQQESLKALLVQKNAQETKKIKELSLIYEKMDPDKAALALAKIDDSLATQLLANMKVKAAAKILDALDRKKATELSTTYSTVK